MIVNLKICGVGGQGVITTGIIASEAGISRGLNVVMSEIHGLAQRGGAVSVDIRFGDALGSMIPENRCDILVALEPVEALRNVSRIKEGGLALIGTERIPPISLGISGKEYPDVESVLKENYPGMRYLMVNSDEIAKQAGNPRTSNTVILGAAIATGVLPIDLQDVMRALDSRFTGEMLESNKKALGLGAKLVTV